MKKLLLACAAAAFSFGFASAETIAFVAEGATYSGDGTVVTLPTGNIAGTTYTSENICSFLITKVNSSTSQVNSNVVRWYANDVLELTPADGITINSVTIACTSNWGAITIDSSTQTPSATNKMITFSGLDTTEKVSVTHSAQNRFSYVEVVYTSAGASDLEAANLSFPEAEYSVKYPNGTFTAPVLSKDTDAVATYTSSNEEVATVAADGAVTILKPGTTVITARCEANDKYAAGTAKYTLTVYASASSLQDLSELSALDASGTFQIDCPLTVTYANDRSVYVVDTNGDATLIFVNSSDTGKYKEGDVLASEWMVKYNPFNGLPEYVPVGNLPEVTAEGATFSIPEISLAQVNDSYINKLFVIKDLTLTEEIPATKTNVTVTNGDYSLAFRNNFGLAAFTPDAEKKYSVKGILAIYTNASGSTLQFYPIEYNIESGVAAIESAEGTATYFDLNGRQVKGQLTNGLYVKVLNGKASKVVVK